MEHYITEINIEMLRHLSNIVISLNPEQRQHLIITGKNGSGKTSLLVTLQKYLQLINTNEFDDLMNNYIPQVQKAKQELNKAKTEAEKNEIKINYDYEYCLREIKQYAAGVYISFDNSEALYSLFKQGDFITAYFPANRKTQIVRAQGVEDIKLSDAYAVNSQPGQLLHKYMVHLKTQQAYARNEGDMVTVNRIQKWFERFAGALRILLDNDSIELKYDYKEYDFKIHESGRNPFSLDELSDGYSSVVKIVSDLILRMDKNWLLGDKISQYDIEGIVLIDEIETHLHIALQKKIMPFLTEFFPRIQFIVTTHSPFVGEDENGEKVGLDAEKVLSIPRRIRSQEVVRRGFMSDFLFQNISHVFYAPQEVIDIITAFTPVQEPSKKADITPDMSDALSLDGNGEVSLEEGYVIGRSADIFGEKIYESIPNKLNDIISDIHMAQDEMGDYADKLKQSIHTEAVRTIIDTAKEEYASDMKSSTRNQIERKLKKETDSLVNKAVSNYKIETNTIEKERQEALDNRIAAHKSEEEVNQEFDKRQEDAASKLQETLNTSISDFVKSASEDVVRTIETNKKEREKKGIEDSVKDHLRGFPRGYKHISCIVPVFTGWRCVY